MSTFDPLDMNNYKVEKLPKMQKSNFEKWMARLGGPLAIIAFIVIYFRKHIFYASVNFCIVEACFDAHFYALCLDNCGKSTCCESIFAVHGTLESVSTCTYCKGKL